MPLLLGDAMSDSDTRMRLILAAEQLFAENGIEGVSLRQVNVAAGQKNASATHYHFGSKDALIEAIFSHRMEAINARRTEILDALDGLPRKYRLPIVLRYFEELDYKGIAEILGLDRAQVGNLLFRAKQRLRSALLEAEEEEGGGEAQ